MKELENLREMLSEELAKISKKGELSAGSLEAVDKLTHSIKSIDTIMAMAEKYSHGGSYDGGSYGNGSYGGSYDGSYDGSYGRGSYDGRSYGNGNSYDRDRYGRYSRDEARATMVNRLASMMDEATSEKEREAIRRCIESIQKF